MQKVLIGRFGAPHGIRGWVRVISHTDPVDNILAYQPWYTLDAGTGAYRPVDLSDGQPHGKHLIIKIKGMNDRDRAAELTHRDIYVDQDQLPRLTEGEYYWTDLEGLTVITTTGEQLGTVDHLIATGANDVIVVTGKQRLLLPYVDRIVKSVDLVAGTITVDPEAS